MILATTENVPGKGIVAVKGLVQGNTMRSRRDGRDIMTDFRDIVGGEIAEYTGLMAESRKLAADPMVAEATDMGANAEIGARFVTSMVLSSASALVGYGTAVAVEDEE